MAEYRFSTEAGRIIRSEIREMLSWSRRADTVSFGGGLPDPSLFPLAEIEEATGRLLRDRGYLALQYGPTQGEPVALEAFSRHMAAYGDQADPGRLCVTSSSQQALDILALLFLDPGSPVIVEIPSYVGAIQAFSRAGAELRGVPLGKAGMDLDALEAELRRLDAEGKAPRFIYVIPDYQNPAGVTMDLAARKRLLGIAEARGIPLVEDSPYRELAFDGAAEPSLWSLSGGKGVILLKTFSKMLFPGYRLGWVAAEPEVIDKVVALKQSIDLCTSSFVQLLAADYIERGLMRGTIDKARALYRPKRDAMIAGLDRILPAGSSRSTPAGGVFLWASLPPRYDAKLLLKRSLEEGVAFIVGTAFHCDGGGQSSLRLNFSFPSLEAIGIGLDRLGTALEGLELERPTIAQAKGAELAAAGSEPGRRAS